MKKSSKLVALLLVLTLLVVMCFALVACDGGTKTDTSDESESPLYGERSAVDMSGNTVTVSGEIKKIVNLWPAGTSSFIAMGAGNLLSAVAVNGAGTMNAWSKLFYEDALSIPALGGTTPNVEAILNLEPDLVIIHPTTAGSDLHKALIDAGIPTANINFSTYETMVQAYTFLATILGGDYKVKLEKWCAAVNSRINAAREMTKNVNDADKPIVYYVAGQSDSRTTTMASNSIINDWVTSAGGKFAMAEWTFNTDDYNTVTRGGKTGPDTTSPKEEYILSKDVDVVMVGGIYQHKLSAEIKTNWAELDAVKNNRVYTNPYACFNWDRFGLESLLQINYALYRIQPVIAVANGITEASIKADIKDFYSTYTGYNLTDEQVNNMYNGLTPAGTKEVA